MAVGAQNPPVVNTREFMIASSVPYDGMTLNGLGYNGPPGHMQPFGKFNTPPPPREFRDVIDVEAGKRYRLRLINAGSSFSAHFCVDDHRLTVIASDGADTEPFEVDCVNLAVAERYDVILHANQSPTKNYWVRAATLEFELNHTAYAVLAYSQGPGRDAMPTSFERLAWDEKEIANCFDWGGITDKCHSLTELRRHPLTCYWGYCGAPDQNIVPHDVTVRFTFPAISNFIRFGYNKEPFTGEFVQNELPNLGVPLVHGYDGATTHGPLSDQYTSRGYGGERPLFSDSEETEYFHPSSTEEHFLHGYGREGGTIGWHTNSMVMEVADGEFAELIFNQADRQSHPMHIHGHKLWVMGIGYGSPGDDFMGCIFAHCFQETFDRMDPTHRAKLVDPQHAILKDSVVLPAGGWLVLRFVADNPGWWFVHCHIDIHRSNGFNFMIREGGDLAEVDEARLPSDFPVCDAALAREHVACMCYQDTDSVLDLGARPYYRCSTKATCRHALPSDKGPLSMEVAGVRRRELQRPLRYVVAGSALLVMFLLVFGPTLLSCMCTKKAATAPAGATAAPGGAGARTAATPWEKAGAAAVEEEFQKVTRGMQGALDKLTSAGLSIVWQDLSVVTGSGSTQKKLLSHMYGVVRPGEMMAVMGTSGSGKSTLLDVLAGRQLRGSSYVGEGSVHLGGVDVRDIRWGDLKNLRSYVPQDDVLQHNLSVREALMSSTRLRKPMVRRASNMKDSAASRLVLSNAALKDIGMASIPMLVDSTLKTLKLEHRADTVIARLSGGERRRLMVAMRSIVRQPVMLMDEPTSGLDAQSAMELVQWSKQLSINQQKATIMTIHTPNSALFGLFDKLLLLHRGELIFVGSLPQAAAFFASIDKPTPPLWNPADFYLSLMNEEGRQIGQTYRSSPEFTKRSMECQTSVETDLKANGQATGAEFNAILEEIELSIAKQERSLGGRGSSKKRQQRRRVSFAGEGDGPPKFMRGTMSQPPVDISKVAEETPLPQRQTMRSRSISNIFGLGASTRNEADELNEDERWASSMLDFNGTLELYNTSWFKQVVLLFQREVKQEWPQVINWQSLLLNMTLSCMIGAIWYATGSGRDERAFRETIAFFFYINLYWAFTSMYGAIPSLQPKLALLQLNINEGVHGLGAWCTARWLVDAIFVGLWPSMFCCCAFAFTDIGKDLESIGTMLAVMYANCMAAQSFGLAVAAVIPDLRMAQLVGSFIMQTTAASTGYYTTLPPWLTWYMDVSMPRYTFEGLLRSEFGFLDSYNCPSAEGDAFAGPYLCPVEKLLITDDLKIRGVHFAEVGIVTSPWESAITLVIFAVIFRFTLYLALRWLKMTQWRQASGEVATKRGLARFVAKLKAFLKISSFARISDTNSRASDGRKSGFMGVDVVPTASGGKPGQSAALAAALSKNISSNHLGRSTDRTTDMGERSTAGMGRATGMDTELELETPKQRNRRQSDPLLKEVSGSFGGYEEYSGHSPSTVARPPSLDRMTSESSWAKEPAL